MLGGFDIRQPSRQHTWRCEDMAVRGSGFEIRLSLCLKNVI